MKELFNLGELYVSDFLGENDEPRGGKVEMKLLLDEKTGNVRLETPAPLDVMYGKYWYRSGINQSMKNELKRIVDSILDVKKLKENDIWVDIACNDGTMFDFIPDNIIKIGIDPVDNTYKEESEKKADLIIQDYFTSKTYKKSKFGSQKAKIVTSIAMFYDLEEPERFIKDVGEILDDNGLWVLQLSYTPLMIEQLAFDNICHEHVYYHSLGSLVNLFGRNNFTVIDANVNDVNGGSIRVYLVKNTAKPECFGTEQLRSVCWYRTEAFLEMERIADISNVEIWREFGNRLEKLKSDVLLV